MRAGTGANAGDEEKRVSEQPQGPGWWLASDGRYYPPELAPGAPPLPSQPIQQAPYQQPVQQQPQSGQQLSYQQAPYQQAPYQQAPYQQAPYQLAPKGGSGKKIAIIVTVAIMLLVVVPGVGLFLFVRVVSNKATNLIGAGACSIVSNDRAGKALGAPVSLNSGTGIGALVAGAIDNRVLPDAPSCFATIDPQANGQLPTLIRISRKTGDAKTTFRQEVTKAKGVTVKRTGDISVQSDPYYGKAVTGLGDEAFCTTMAPTGSVGVLARRGDTLVYTAVTVAFAVSGPDPSPTAAADLTLPDEAKACTRAQTLARAVLAA
jgi:hypothetical protein